MENNLKGNEENWKQIEEFPDYEASDLGRLRNKRGKILKLTQHKTKGYYLCLLYRNKIGKTVVVHRIIATTFIPNPGKKPNILHLNRDKNDNRVENLQWATHYECVDNALTPHRQKVLTETQEDEIRDRLLSGETGINLSWEYKVSQMTITRIRKKYGIKTPEKSFV